MKKKKRFLMTGFVFIFFIGKICFSDSELSNPLLDVKKNAQKTLAEKYQYLNSKKQKNILLRIFDSLRGIQKPVLSEEEKMALKEKISLLKKQVEEALEDGEQAQKNLEEAIVEKKKVYAELQTAKEWLVEKTLFKPSLHKEMTLNAKEKTQLTYQSLNLLIRKLEMDLNRAEKKEKNKQKEKESIIKEASALMYIWEESKKLVLP